MDLVIPIAPFLWEGVAILAVVMSFLTSLRD